MNNAVNGEHLLKIFIEVLICDVKNNFDISDINENEHILNLTSSTESKFSHHIIVNHPQLIFVNNYAVGKYVKYLCEKLRDISEMIIVTDEITEATTPSHKATRYGTFIDEGVYTKNRNFRLYLSSKFNKNVQLKLFRAVNKSERCVFLNSLVSVPNRLQCRLGKKSNVDTKLLTFEYDDPFSSPRINRMSATLLAKNLPLNKRYWNH